VRGASKGEGLGNQFLANIREVDAIVHVLRRFEGGDVTHVEGRIDPIADAEVSITSHEQFETVSDAEVGTAQQLAPPLAWYDAVVLFSVFAPYLFRPSRGARS